MAIKTFAVTEAERDRDYKLKLAQAQASMDVARMKELQEQRERQVNHLMSPTDPTKAWVAPDPKRARIANDLMGDADQLAGDIGHARELHAKLDALGAFDVSSSRIVSRALPDVGPLLQEYDRILDKISRGRVGGESYVDPATGTSVTVPYINIHLEFEGKTKAERLRALNLGLEDMRGDVATKLSNAVGYDGPVVFTPELEAARRAAAITSQSAVPQAPPKPPAGLSSYFDALPDWQKKILGPR